MTVVIDELTVASSFRSSMTADFARVRAFASESASQSTSIINGFGVPGGQS